MDSSLTKRIFSGIKEANITRNASSVAFYAMYALAPMLVIFVSIGGLVMDQGVVETQLVSFAENRAGEEVASFLMEAIDSIKKSEAHLIFSFIGLFIMIYGLMHFFNALKHSLFSIFEVDLGKEKTIKKTLFNYIKSILFSFYLAIMFFALVFVSIITPIILSFSSNFLGFLTKIPLLDLVIALTLTLLILSVMYKNVSLNRISWRSAFLGAVSGALLLSLLNIVLVFYLKLFDGAHAIYGASGSLVAFLLWVYYSSMILLIGALVSSLVEKPKLIKW